MARNKLEDLNNHLFAQIERLTDEETVKDEQQLEFEVERSKALCGLSSQIVDVNKTVLEAYGIANGINGKFQLPNTLGIEKKDLGIDED